MKMLSEQPIAAPRQRVWEALNDPEILRASIPGCQSLDKEADDRFTATVEVKAGPIGARFKGAVSAERLHTQFSRQRWHRRLGNRQRETAVARGWRRDAHLLRG
jgi:carbon monoxide dehydrogenase subunit G